MGEINTDLQNDVDVIH